MKRITSAVVAAVLATAVTIPPQALSQRRGRIVIRPQPPPAHGPRGRYVDVDYPTPEKRAANLADLLSLTEEQKQKVVAIFVEQDKQVMALWSDESLTAEVRAKKLNDARHAAMKKVRELLTDEQKKKYDALGADEKPAEN